MRRQQHTSAMIDKDSRYSLRVESAEVVPANCPEIGGWFVRVRATIHEALLIQPANCSLETAEKAAREIVGQKVVFCGPGEWVD